MAIGSPSAVDGQWQFLPQTASPFFQVLGQQAGKGFKIKILAAGIGRWRMAIQPPPSGLAKIFILKPCKFNMADLSNPVETH
ncbi:MAG: hypothetical protein WAK95_14830, partial [Desulfobacterales bacterium]